MSQTSPVARRRLYRGRLGRVNFEPGNRTLVFAGTLIHRTMRLITRADWGGQANVPQTGPVIFTPNHISSLDPLVIAEFIVYSGRWPRFLARANLFDVPIIRGVLQRAGQIPVHRGSRRAKDALVAADQAIGADRAVIIYPEGTITFDPLEWPMAAHTGAARLALRTGAPVVPIGQWGANYALPPRGIRKFRLRRWPVTVVCGTPVDLSDLDGAWQDRAAVHEATVRIMTAITGQVEQARGAQAPADRWHQKLEKRVPPEQAVL